MSKRTLLVVYAVFLSLFLSGCRQWDNFTTYFNTYYNSNKLLREAEEEFDYQEEKARVKPRVFVPQKNLDLPNQPDRGVPPFLNELIISKSKMQPVKVKLDSIIIKGSKILAKHPKSDYIQKTLYIMALSYFYQNYWLNSQIKCSELIDRYPDGELSPDAHLLLVKNYLIQRKILAGKTLLSRTVDVSWQLKRYDILSEAFRIEAELALFENDIDGAVRPYRQAIAQADDDAVKAKWQVDMAALLFRKEKFQQAEKMFAKVRTFQPDYQAEFESYLYQASCLTRLRKFDEADKILTSLENNKNWDEWRANIFAERMNLYRIRGADSIFIKTEKYADTAFISSDAVSAQYYERGIDYFYDKNYSKARQYLAKARGVSTPVSKQASYLYKLLNTWDEKRTLALPYLKKIDNKEELADSSMNQLALYCFELGRVQEQLGNRDSADLYYQKAIDISPKKNENSARYLYAFSRFIENNSPAKSDSILEIIVERYPLTEYGIEARKKQGYTDAFIIDTVAELYSSGSKLRQTRQYDIALVQFMKIYHLYSNSDYVPKSLYAIGWVFEKNLHMFDSAVYYYQILLDKYPSSEYAKDIKFSIDYYAAKKSGDKMPDSMKTRIIQQYKAKPIILDDPDQQASKKVLKPGGTIDAKDIISSPMDFLKQTYESITNPTEVIDDAKKQFNSMTDIDSLKKRMTPGLKISNPLEGIKRDSSGIKPPPPDDKNKIPPPILPLPKNDGEKKDSTNNEAIIPGGKK